MPTSAAGTVTLELRLNREPEAGTELAVRISHGETVLVDQDVAVPSSESRTVLRLPALDHIQDGRRLLWSPERPTLLDAALELRASGAEPDRIGSYLGIRTTEVADGTFLLNGHPYFLRLVLEQGFWPQSHLAAPSLEALRREVELIKQLGFNGARIHQKVEDPRFLYWCDKLGAAGLGRDGERVRVHPADGRAHRDASGWRWSVATAPIRASSPGCR